MGISSSTAIIASSGIRFEQFIADVLAHEGFTDGHNSSSATPDTGIDFILTRDGIVWAIEAMHYRSPTVPAAYVAVAAKKLVERSQSLKIEHALLVVSSDLDGTAIAAIERKYGMTIVDRSRIIYWLRESVYLSDRLYSVLEMPSESRGKGTPWELDKVRRIAAVKPSDKPPSRSADLEKELGLLAPGKKDARAYEALCCQVISHLFEDAVVNGLDQATTEDKLNRFDFVCRMRPSSEFWKFVATDLRSRYMLFEFKNYAGPISQGQILTTEEYLFGSALRTVAIIFTRRGAGESARKMIQGAMREHGKLMIVLDDSVVIKMLTMKEEGADPSDLLFDMVDKFLIALSR